MATATLGIDLGIKSGAAVLLTSQEAVVVASWLKSNVRVSDPPNEQLQYLQDVLITPLSRVLMQRLPLGSLVAIDWDPNDAYWGNSKQAAVKGLLAGYLYRYLVSQSYRPVFMPPAYVRQRLDLRQKSNKHEVFSRMGFLLEGQPEILSCYSNMNEHEKDSFILAKLVDQYS